MGISLLSGGWLYKAENGVYLLLAPMKNEGLWDSVFGV